MDQQARFTRGTDTLWHEQADAYGAAMIGRTPTRARDQVARAEHSASRRTRIANRKALQVSGFHTAMFPDAYAPIVHEHALTSLLTDRTVSDRQSERWLLESAADAFLAMHGEPNDGLDRTHRGHLKVKADRVAYRGQVRYRASAPVRYGKPTERIWVATTTGVVGLVTLHRTTVVGRGVTFTGCASSNVGPWVKACKADRWMGHRGAIASTTREARRASVKARPEGLAAKGPVPSWWNMNTRTLPRWWAKATAQQMDTASMVEAVVTMSTIGKDIELADGYVVTLDDAATVVRGDQRYGIRDYARRAALAGLVID